MTNICKTVSLRTRKIKDGKMLSYYLDYYPGYRDEATMKVMRHESLGIYIYANPKNARERDYNDRMAEKAAVTRASSTSVMTSSTRKRRKVTSSHISEGLPQRRTPSGNMFTSTLRDSLAANARLVKLMWTCAVGSWTIC